MNKPCAICSHLPEQHCDGGCLIVLGLEVVEQPGGVAWCPCAGYAT